MWALIVCYYPDVDKLQRLIIAIQGGVERVVILDNGGVPEGSILAINSKGKIVIVKMLGNIGLGGAFNHGFQLANDAGVEYVLTFDQDSAPTSEYPREILDEYIRVKKIDENVVALGPTIIDGRDPTFTYSFAGKAPSDCKNTGSCRVNDEDLVSVLVLIQSGMIVSVKIWSNICKFDDRLFIEFVDTDWCYRVCHAGYSIYGSRRVSMRHEISDRAPYKLFGFSLLSYSPIRRYYFFRNAIYLLRQDYIPLSQKIRLITGMFNRLLAIILLDECKGQSCSEMFRGLRAGVVGLHRGPA